MGADQQQLLTGVEAGALSTAFVFLSICFCFLLFASV